MNHTIFHIKEVLRFPVFTVYYDVPVIQVLSVKKFDFLFRTAGEDCQGKAK